MTFEVSTGAVAALVRRGRLGEERRQDRVAIETAIARLLSDALREMYPWTDS